MALSLENPIRPPTKWRLPETDPANNEDNDARDILGLGVLLVLVPLTETCAARKKKRGIIPSAPRGQEEFSTAESGSGP